METLDDGVKRADDITNSSNGLLLKEIKLFPQLIPMNLTDESIQSTNTVRCFQNCIRFNSYSNVARYMTYISIKIRYPTVPEILACGYVFT